MKLCWHHWHRQYPSTLFTVTYKDSIRCKVPKVEELRGVLETCCRCNRQRVYAIGGMGIYYDFKYSPGDF